MGYRCCVPNCKGNYDNGPKVSVFSFPKDKNLQQRWIQAIHRKDFQPTQYSKVCEMHFNSCDIVRAVEAYKENGEKLQAPLHRIKLKQGAIPTILPGCPSYLTTESFTRESAEERRERHENENLQRAIQQSLITQQKYDEKNKFHTYDEFLNLLDSVKVSCEWSVMKKNKSFAVDELDDNYSLIKNIDRGGLLYPQPDVVNVVILNYVTVRKLIGKDYEQEFLQVREQRELIMKLSQEIINEFNFFLDGFSCQSHSKDFILTTILKSSTNIMLNNYVKLKNDNISKNKYKREGSCLQFNSESTTEISIASVNNYFPL